MRVNPDSTSSLVSSLDATYAAEQKLSGQISSGVRVSALSDDPIAAGQNVQIAARLSQDDTFIQTASSAQSMMQVNDAALGSVVSQLTQAISVSTAGGSGTANAADMSSTAQQLTGIRDEVLSLANTSYMGRYIFGGTQGNVVPFSLNTTNTPAVATYTGDNQPTFIESPNGQKIQTNLPGGQIFTSTGADVLNTLNALIADFSSGDLAGAQSNTTELSSALAHLSTQRASLDSSMQSLQSTDAYVQTEKTQLTASQTTLMQADIPSVATGLSTLESQQAALDAVIATLEKQGNLFSMLQ